ncbi:MAG: hypothetical protein WKG03_04695 [Telluria sp.]
MQTKPSTTRQRHALAAALVLCFAVTGCATVTPAIPQDIAATGTAFKVRSAGRMYQLFGKGYFQVGSYGVTGIHHDISVGNELSIGQYSQASATGRFTFAIAGPRSNWSAQCDRQFQSRTIAMRRVDVESSKRRLYCELGSGMQRASLELHDNTRGQFGTVRINDTSYDMRHFDNPALRVAYAPDALGLRIDRGGRNVAALAFDHPGTFWLNGALEPEQQDAFAAVLAALLINARQ